MSYLDQFKRDNPGIEKYTDDEILAVLPDIDPALRDMTPDEVKSFATSSAPSGLGSIIKSGYDSVMGNRDIKKGVSQVSDLNDPEFSDLEKGYNENSSFLGISGDKLRRKTKAATGKTDELYNEAQGYLDSGAESLQKAGSVTLSPSTQKFLNDESESSWLSDFLDDPVTIITEIGAQSAYGSLESLVSGVAGAAAAGPAGLAAGAGAGSARVEFASSFVESLKEAGVDLSDARNLQVALQENPDLYRSATEEALVRSGIIGAADAATMGLATKSLGLGSGLTKQVSNAAAQGVVQTGGGAAGEAGAQLAVDGEISSPRQVAAEAVGELVTAPVDIAAGSYTAARELKQGAQPQPDETPADPVQSNIDDINQFKDSLTAQEMGLSMPEPVDYSQYDQPAVNRVGEQLDGLSEIEQAIRIAEKEGFADEAVRLNTAKSYFDKAELARQQGMESVAGEFSEKGNAIYRDVMEQPLPEQQTRPDQFPQPYVSEGEIQGGELATVDQPQAEMEPTPDIEGQSQEIPQEQLPPGTNQINQGYERPERQFSPVDPLHEGVGRNVVERQAGDKQALPPANPARSITPDQLQSLQKIRGVALRTKIRERTPEQIEAIQIVEAVKAGEVEVSNDRSDNAGNGVYRGNEGAPSNNTEGGNGDPKTNLSSQAASTQLPELPGTLEASSNADSSMGAGREVDDSALDVSLNAKGLPYVSEKSAKASKAYRSNKEAAKVVPVEGGFGIATPKAEQRKTSKPSDSDLSVVSESLSYAESKSQVNDLRTNNQNDQFFVRPNKATKGKFDIYTDGKAIKPEAAVITEPVVKQTPVKPAETSENTDITETASKGESAVFKPDSGTLNIPRSEMPQIKAEHRGAMVNFMNARGIKHDQTDVDPLTLKPTQADFVPEKVKAAKEYKGGDRSILISSDNHVLDGHHQWLAKRESGQPIKVIKLDAPIADLVPLANEFPSSENEQGDKEGQPESENSIPEVSSIDQLEALPTYSVYKQTRKPDGAIRYLVRGTGKQGMGDTIHTTVADAHYMANSERRRAEGKKETEQAREAQKKVESQAKAERDADTVNGFTRGMTKLQAGRVKTALDKTHVINSKPSVLRTYIDNLHAEGNLTVSTEQEPRVKPMSRKAFNRATQAEQDSHERRTREAGTKNVYYINDVDLGKTAHDYAKHLLSQSDASTIKSGDREGGGLAASKQKPSNQATEQPSEPKTKPAKTVSPKFSRTRQSEPTIPLTKSSDQSEAKFLGNYLSRYFNDEQWKNAFASYALPDSLGRFGSAVQAAFGKRVAAVMPTERKFDILDGMHIPGHESIFVNPSNRVSFVAVTGHELYHHIAKSRPDLHKWLVGKLQSQVDSDRFEAYRERLDALIQEGEALHSDAQIQEELLADLMGDAMADKPFLEALAKDNPTYFRRLVNAINIYLNKIKGKLKGLNSKRYFNDVSAMQKHLRSVLNAYADGVEISEVATPKTSNENVVELAKYREEKAAFFEWLREQKAAQKAGNFSRVDAVSSEKNQVADSMENNELADSDLWDRAKVAEDKGYDRVFAHASPSQEFVIPLKRSGFEIFDGIFLNEGMESRYSHGEYQHRYVVSSDKVAGERDSDLDYDQSISFIKSKFPDMTDDQIDSVYNFTAGDENVYDSEDNPLEDYGYPEIHEASWEYQNIRGLIAKDQGFDAIAMNDEFGISYFIPEGSGAKNLLDPEFDLPSSDNARQQDSSSFSRQSQEAEQEPQPVAEAFAIPTDSLVASGIRKIADKFKVLKDLQANIKATGAEIDETADAYMAEELFHGKAENDLRQMRQTFVEPLAKKMADFGITQAELDKYLYAKHAAERNDHIAEINPDLQDGGSGMTNAEASEIISNVELSGKANQYEQVAAIVYDMLAAKRDQIRAAGLEDSDVVDAWEASYQHYVPLKGYAADETQDGLPRSGKGFTIGGKESKRALGRTSEAASPSSYAISDLTETLIRKRKNEVGNAFLNLVEANPNSDYWQVFTEENPETDRRIVKSKDPLTGEAIETVKEMPLPMAMLQDRYFTTKRDGVTHYIKLEDPRLMKAMKNIGPDTSNFVIQGMAKVNRFLSAVNTSYNPEFVVGNFARDIQTAALNLSAEQTRDDGKAKGEQIVKQTIKDVPKAMKAVYRSMRGKPAKNAEWANYFEEFQADGAKTGYFDMKDIDGQAKDVQRLIDISKGGFKGGFYKWTQAAGKLVEDTNNSVENAVRLSAYVNARKAGISRAKAASLAKNMTVNFNRRGEMGTTLNALYMFANASIQGSMNFARTMIGLNGEKGDPIWSRLNKAQKISIGIMAGSYAFAMANRMGAGEDDDGENWYDKVPQYVKERNLVIMKSLLGGDADGSYYKIPLPYGYNIFHVFGTSMESAVDDPRKTGQAATDLMLAALGSFSPIGFQDSNSTTGTILKNLTPTIGKPIVDVAMNENFMGGSIYNENFPFGTPKPESSLSRRSTPEAYKAVAEFLNEQTGGSQWRSGGVDINPDVMRYFVDYALGGSGKFFLNKAPSNLTGMVDGVQPDISRVMFLSRVNGKVLPYEDQSKFYDRRDEIKQIVDEVKETRGPEKAKLLAEYSGKLRLLGMIKATESQLKILRKQRNAIYNEDLAPKSRDEKLKAVELKMKTVVDRFNKAYKEADQR